MGMWGHRVLRSVAALALLLLLALVQSFTLSRMAGDAPPLFGRIVDSPGAENDLGVIDLARFAVSQHNKTNAPLEFRKVVKVKQQLVAGLLYYLTILVNEGGAKKLYEAKVVKQLWLDSNSKQLMKLLEFEPADDKLCSLLHIMSPFLPWLNRAGCYEYK